MTIPLHCRCGDVRGHVEPGRRYGYAVCYCRDCQAYARFLDAPGIVDDRGGTAILAVPSGAVRLTAGADRLACMSMGPKGVLRWYAACCRTPIANTARDPRVAYAGVVACTLGGTRAERDAALGPASIALHAASATGPVRGTPVRTFAVGAAIALRLLLARMRGAPPSPFFDSGLPVREPQVLTLAQRRALQGRQG